MRWLFALLVGPPAAIAAANGDGLPGWAQVVLSLAAVLAVATKQLVPGWIYSEQRTRLETTEAENKRLTQTLLETQPKTIAALEASSRTVDEAMAELRVLRRAQ